MKIAFFIAGALLIIFQSQTFAFSNTDSCNNKKSILEAAMIIKDAIERNDVAKILEFVPESGLVCIDSMIAKKEIIESLNKPDDRFYCFLFSGTCFINYQDMYYKMSMYSFFKSAIEGLSR